MAVLICLLEEKEDCAIWIPETNFMNYVIVTD
jgi:hypothetical protein